MSKIRKYILVDRNDVEGDTEYDTMQEAIAAATDEQAVIEYVYVCDATELVWTPDGGNTWPPSLPEDEREVIGQPNYA